MRVVSLRAVWTATRRLELVEEAGGKAAKGGADAALIFHTLAGRRRGSSVLVDVVEVVRCTFCRS